MTASDLKSQLSIASTIAPAAYADTATGTAVDLANFTGHPVVVVYSGAMSNTGFAIEVQESDASGSGFTAVPDALLDGTEPATVEASTITRISYLGRKRYLRVVATDAGSGSGVFGVHVIRTGPRKRPV